MKSHLFILCAASVASLPVLAAQGGGGPAMKPGDVRTQAPAERAPRHHERIETLIGADVRMSTAMHGTVGRTAGQDPADMERDAPTGELDDLVIAPDGAVQWAIVSYDGRDVLVPADSLTWNREEERFDLALSASQLREKPEFDLEKARENGFQQALAAVESAWKDVKKDVTRAAARLTDGDDAGLASAGLKAADDAVLCGSEVDELELYATREEFGGVTKTFVDPEALRIDLLVVSRGGLAGIGDTSYLVPFEALTLCREPLEEDQKPEDAALMLCVGKSVEQLKQAPEYEEPEVDNVLVSPANRAAAVRFFEGQKQKKGYAPAEDHGGKKEGEERSGGYGGGY